MQARIHAHTSWFDCDVQGQKQGAPYLIHGCMVAEGLLQVRKDDATLTRSDDQQTAGNQALPLHMPYGISGRATHVKAWEITVTKPLAGCT